MIYADISVWLILLTAFLGAVVVAYITYRIYQKLVYQFRSLSNLLAALTQGDYSLRAKSDQAFGEMGELVIAINGLAERLSKQRRESVESQLLVSTIIEHIDVAIIALNDANSISFMNPAACKLLVSDQPSDNTQLLQQLAFVHSLSSGKHQVVELVLGRQRGRFNVHVEEFREAGIQHKLLFITDVRTLLRSEERKAWQSLVRVISHEINNSLSPIASISQTLSRIVGKRECSDENDRDVLEGLVIINQRAEGLKQFVDSYKQLARLPEPRKQVASIKGLLVKVCALFNQQQIKLASNSDYLLMLDPVQIEQVLINIIKNAIESMAAVNPQGAIAVNWGVAGTIFTLNVCDEGAGVSNPDNLFVPFYSTKKNGSGIGLVLCRQIVEAHDGRISIANRVGSQGSCVCIELPYSEVQLAEC